MIQRNHISDLLNTIRELRAQSASASRDQSGSALVEMALSAVVLFSMLFGVIEFGYALYTFQFVNEVSREMTRYAIVRGSACSTSSSMTNCGFTDTDTTLQAYARSAYAYPGINMSNLTVTNTWYSPVKNSDGTVASWTACGSGTCNVPGNMVKVTVSYPFVLGIPFVPSRSLTVSSDSSMVISQ